MRWPAAEVAGTEVGASQAGAPQVQRTMFRGPLVVTEPTFQAIMRPIRTAPSWTITPPREISTRGPENLARSRRTELLQQEAIIVQRRPVPSHYRPAERHG